MGNVLITSFQDAGLLGKTIIIFLLGLSVYLWTLAQIKYLYFKNARKQNEAFLNLLQEKRISLLNFEPEDTEEFQDSPLYKIFSSTQNIIKDTVLARNRIDPSDIQTVELLLQKLISEEKLRMEESSYILASMSSNSTLLGLLGTVIGVMNSFRSMGTMGTASITAVAPGIAEALITTAMGIIVAIPAAALYNFVMSNSRIEMVRLNNFASEISKYVEDLGQSGRENGIS